MCLAVHEPHEAPCSVQLPTLASGGECEYGEFVRKIIDLSSVLSTRYLCLYGGLLILREIFRDSSGSLHLPSFETLGSEENQ